MFRSTCRDRASASRVAALRRPLLILPGLVLALNVVAIPAHADPEGPPDTGQAGRSSAAPGVDGDLPAPAHAAAHDAVNVPAAPPVAPPVGEPQGPPAQTPPAATPAAPAAVDGPPAVPPGEVRAAEVRSADAAPPAAAAGRGQKVVVCKYVRKPGAAEIFSHIVVVNENGLLGKGFAGTFPFAFSDAHFKSIAVRFAAQGEQAREISPAVCPGVPPGEEPPGEEPPGGEPPGDVGGISEEQDPAAMDGVDAALPRTGAPPNLQLLALLGGLCSLAGAWLVARGVRIRR